MKNEIWQYWSCGKEIFAVVNPNDVSSNVISSIDNRQTIGETDASTSTFRDEKSLIEHIEDSKFEFYEKRLS